MIETTYDTLRGKIHKRTVPEHTNCTLCSCYKNQESEYVSDTLLIETDNFFLVPQYHGIIPGYVLLSSKRHVNSTAYLNHVEFNELKFMIEVIAQFLNHEFGFRPIIFEHGSSNSNVKGTVHQHIHFLPIKFTNTDILINEYSLRFLDCLDDLRVLGKDKDYLYFQNNERKMYFAEDRNNVKNPATESNTLYSLRKHIAEHFGNQEIFFEPLENYENNIRETIKMWKSSNNNLMHLLFNISSGLSVPVVSGNNVSSPATSFLHGLRVVR